METKSDHCFRFVLENDRVRLFKVDVAGLQSTSVNYHRHDYVVVSLGKSNFEIAGSGLRYPMQMEDGEMQVIKGGASHRITNLSDSLLQLVEMEVMREIHPERPAGWTRHAVTESLAFSSALAVCCLSTITIVAMFWFF
jgi:mannose-6-phosphate isomerase-like protein (cupin superfamily)